MNKDFSKLRAFDLEAAKAGSPIMLIENGKHIAHDAKYVAGPDGNGNVILNIGGLFSRPDRIYLKNIFMAPLAWVRKSEGEDVMWPVYKGDVVYNRDGKRRTVTGVSQCGSFNTEEVGTHTCYPEECIFTPPKPKTRQIKMLCYFTGTTLDWREEGKPIPGCWKRVPAEDKIIEVEE